MQVTCLSMPWDGRWDFSGQLNNSTRMHLPVSLSSSYALQPVVPKKRTEEERKTEVHRQTLPLTRKSVFQVALSAWHENFPLLARRGHCWVQVKDSWVSCYNSGGSKSSISVTRPDGPYTDTEASQSITIACERILGIQWCWITVNQWIQIGH
jgi:hypothetical protein